MAITTNCTLLASTCPVRASIHPRLSHFSERRMFAAAPRRLLAWNIRRPRQFGMGSTSRAAASSRLQQISKHLDPKPFLELNTPFSTERSSRLEDERGQPLRPQKQEQQKTAPQKQAETPPQPPKKMSSNQAPHPALLIPGPIEFDDAVLNSMSHYRSISSHSIPSIDLLTILQ